MRRDESHITKRVTSMSVDGHPRRGQPRKRWMDCVKDDRKIKRVSIEMTSDRRMEEDNMCQPHLVGGEGDDDDDYDDDDDQGTYLRRPTGFTSIELNAVYIVHFN
jgi:hypothetical protein